MKIDCYLVFQVSPRRRALNKGHCSAWGETAGRAPKSHVCCVESYGHEVIALGRKPSIPQMSDTVFAEGQRAPLAVDSIPEAVSTPRLMSTHKPVHLSFQPALFLTFIKVFIRIISLIKYHHNVCGVIVTLSRDRWKE